MSVDDKVDKDEKKDEIPDRVIVRGYAKTVYLWPTMLVGFFLFTVDYVANNFMDMTPSVEFNAYLGSLWLLMFTFNIVVISFDFSLGKTFTIIVSVAFLILLYILLREWFFPDGLGLNTPSIKKVLVDLNITASPNFYAFISLVIFLILLVVFIYAHFNYWEFESNRISHHRGFFEREENFNAQSSRVITQTDDIFERLLWRAGTIYVIDTQGTVHRIENVYNAVGKDKVIQDLLSVIRVRD